MSTIAASQPEISADNKAQKLSRIKAIVAASSGNLVEWYDFYAYAFTSIYFAAAFFPSGDQSSARPFSRLTPFRSGPRQWSQSAPGVEATMVKASNVAASKRFFMVVPWRQIHPWRHFHGTPVPAGKGSRARRRFMS